MILAQAIGLAPPVSRQGKQRGEIERRRLASRDIDPQERVGVLDLPATPGVGPVEAEQRGDFRVSGLRQKEGAPAERGGGHGRAADRVPGVELAIAKGALPIFPGLPPGHGGKAQEKAALGQRLRLRESRPRLQPMLLRRIVIERRAVIQAGEGVEDRVSLGWMQISGGGIVA